MLTGKTWNWKEVGMEKKEQTMLTRHRDERGEDPIENDRGPSNRHERRAAASKKKGASPFVSGGKSRNPRLRRD